ncbi:MAG: hypothetical protein K5917_06880 [Clostridiales bacterium]|nr:hypothetical protein [Clostridiales bacterium]
MKNKNSKKNFSSTPSMVNNSGNPQNSSEMLNKYGTYEIQPTSDTENAFPKISQGLPQKEYRKDYKE